MDWIVRHDDTTGTNVAVVYMGGGSKSGENNAFTDSTLTEMAWGDAIKKLWVYLIQSDEYYTANNIIKFA